MASATQNQRNSKDCVDTLPNVSEVHAAPTEEVVDAALVKSQQLLGELTKLGFSFDLDEQSDASTCYDPTCCDPSSPLSSDSFMPISGHKRHESSTSASSGPAISSCSGFSFRSCSDAEDEGWTSEINVDSNMQSLSSPVGTDMAEHEHSITRLLALRDRVRRIKEQSDQGDANMIQKSSEAIIRLEEHFQTLTALAERSNNGSVESRLQKLEERFSQLKRRPVTSSSIDTLARPQSPTARSRVTTSARVLGRSPSPTQRVVNPRTVYAVSPVRSPVARTRAISPSAPKRLVRHQVAVTNVYNFWSLQA